MNGKTKHRAFNGDGDGSNCVFAVNAGIDKMQAVQHAGMMVTSVREAMTRAIGEARDIDVSEAFLMRDTLLAVDALLEACQ